jgi:hypothetical protein
VWLKKFVLRDRHQINHFENGNNNNKKLKEKEKKIKKKFGETNIHTIHT